MSWWNNSFNVTEARLVKHSGSSLISTVYRYLSGISAIVWYPSNYVQEIVDTLDRCSISVIYLIAHLTYEISDSLTTSCARTPPPLSILPQFLALFCSSPAEVVGGFTVPVTIRYTLSVVLEPARLMAPLDSRLEPPRNRQEARGPLSEPDAKGIESARLVHNTIHPPLYTGSP